MSVGGRLLEIRRWRLRDADDPLYGRDVLRLWVVDGYDELIVYAEPQEDLPAIGEQIWWQAGKIYFDRDRKFLVKIGYSTSA